MAEFEYRSDIRPYTLDEEVRMSRMVSEHRVDYDGVFNNRTGVFEAIDLWAVRAQDPEHFERIMLLHPSLIGKDLETHKVDIDKRGRLRLAKRESNKGILLKINQTRVVDKRYIGSYEVGKSQWLRLDRYFYRNKRYEVTPDRYEEILLNAQSGRAVNEDYEGLIGIRVPASYIGQNLLTLIFDPLVPFTKSGRITTPDAICFDTNGRLVPRNIVTVQDLLFPVRRLLT